MEFSTMLLSTALATTAFSGVHAPTETDGPPGVVIYHRFASTQAYVGSPGIAVLPNGEYLAKCDLFGPKSNESVSGVSLVFASKDGGKSWKRRAEIHGIYWASIFVHRGAAYLMGTSKEYGFAVIRRSTDNGKTWTTPKDAKTGLLLSDAKYHCAPVPVLLHNGRIWRAIEDAMGPGGWGTHFRSLVMSAPEDSDLLDAGNWTHTQPIGREPSWLHGQFGGWLEGNAVAAPDGSIVNVLRVDTPSYEEKVAIIHIAANGKTATFDPEQDFADMPGGAKKFAIRFDPETRLYWTLANYVIPRHRTRSPNTTRNTLALLCSGDLRHWQIRSILLSHPDPSKHGFQYVDWLMEGNDIIAACRTAFDDPQGGAHNQHDANYLTFHRFAGFRNLTERSMDNVPTNLPVFKDGRAIAWPDIRRPIVETATLYQPESEWTYSHHPHIAFFKGRFFAIWSNGRKDEDAPGQRVLLSTSTDFVHWTVPTPLAVPEAGSDGKERVLTAAGFLASNSALTAYYVDYGPHKETTRLFAVTTTDGEKWSTPVDLHVAVCPNHGPQPTASGRLIIAGNISFPYTDDPNGQTGWKITGVYPPLPFGKDDPDAFWPVAKSLNWSAALCEGAFFQTDDHVLKMMLRATGKGARGFLWYTESRDDGATWSPPVEANFSDSDAKFHFGRLPDGRFTYVGNPLAGNRTPLVLSLSTDGAVFNRHFILGETPYAMRKPGQWKGGEYGYPHSLVHDGWLYVIVSRQKEGVEVLRTKIEELKQ